MIVLLEQSKKSLDVINKLNNFDPNRPYIWELKITEDEFCSLERDLSSCKLDR